MTNPYGLSWQENFSESNEIAFDQLEILKFFLFKYLFFCQSIAKYLKIKFYK